MPQPDIESPVARTRLSIVAHRITSPVPVVDHAVRHIGTGPLGQHVDIANRILGRILVQRGLVILANVRRHDGASRTHRDGGADQRVVAFQAGGKYLAIWQRRGVVQRCAVQAFVGAVGKEHLDHLEIDICDEQRVAAVVQAPDAGAVVVAVVVRQPGVDRSFGVADADVVLASGLAAAADFARCIQHFRGEAVLHGRRIDDRVIRAQIGARHREQVFRAARQAAAEGIAHLAEGVVGQRVLAADSQAADFLAFQADEGLAVESLAR